MQKRSYTKDIDWWSVGIIAYELLVGYPPFRGNDRKLRNSIQKDPISWKGVNCSDEFKDLIERLLKREPHLRLGHTGGGKAVLEHAWFPPENIR